MNNLACIILLGWAMVQKPPLESERALAAIDRVRPHLTARLAVVGASWGAPVYLRLFKAEHKLEAWVAVGDTYRLLQTYDICYFSGKPGPKKAEGDLQAPEGFYDVTPDLLNPRSRFHLSFNIGFPNAYDRAHGYTGSWIMVHGNCVSTGCYAMTDPVIEELYALVDACLRAGTHAVPVHIFPFVPTDDALAAAEPAVHRPFWRELQPAYTLFEQTRRVPRVTVRGTAYVVRAAAP